MYVARQDAKLLDWHIYLVPAGVYGERRICGASCEAVARETAALLNCYRLGEMA